MILKNDCKIITFHILNVMHLQFSLLGYHLIAVEGFAYPIDPRRSVVRGFMALVGPPMESRSWGRDQTKRNHL